MDRVSTTRLPKITLEEAYEHPDNVARILGDEVELAKASDGGGVTPEYYRPIQERLGEFDEMRLASMEAAGIEHQIISLTAPGVQIITDPARATTEARRQNDFLAEQVARHPTVTPASPRSHSRSRRTLSRSCTEPSARSECAHCRHQVKDCAQVAPSLELWSCKCVCSHSGCGGGPGHRGRGRSLVRRGGRDAGTRTDPRRAHRPPGVRDGMGRALAAAVAAPASRCDHDAEVSPRDARRAAGGAA